MCYCDVQTFQTKSTMYKQCQQSSQDSAKKKFWLLSWIPPKISRNRRAWLRRQLNPSYYNYIELKHNMKMQYVCFIVLCY